MHLAQMTPRQPAARACQPLIAAVTAKPQNFHAGRRCHGGWPRSRLPGPARIPRVLRRAGRAVPGQAKACAPGYRMDKRVLRCRGRMAGARTTSWRRVAPRLKARSGWRWMQAALRDWGWIVNHKNIKRLMREHDMHPPRRRRFVTTTDSDHDAPVFPDHSKDYVLHGPYRLWVADLTYMCDRLLQNPQSILRGELAPLRLEGRRWPRVAGSGPGGLVASLAPADTTPRSLPRSPATRGAGTG